jgi:hypothetical protein
MEHQDGKSNKMDCAQDFGSSFEITCQSSETSRPGKTTFDDPTLGRQDKAFLGFGQIDNDQFHTCGCGLLLGLVAGVTLIDNSNLDRIACDLLCFFSQLFHLCSFLFVGRRHRHRQQQPNSVNCHMDLAAFLSFTPIVASAFTTRPQDSTIKN